jgi:hypothetical protein
VPEGMTATGAAYYLNLLDLARQRFTVSNGDVVIMDNLAISIGLRSGE